MTTIDTPAETNIMATGTLARIVGEGGINQGLAKSLLDTFAPLAQKADDLTRASAAIVVTDPTQVSAMQEARDARLAIKDVRCLAEDARKEHKADFIKAGKIIEAIANHVKGICEPEEDRLRACEEFAARIEAARKAELAKTRAAELAPLGVDTTGFDLGAMKAEAYAGILEGAKAAKERREREAAEAKAAEEKRLAEEAAERARVAAENARLRAERDAAEAAAAETRRKAEADRAEAERVAKAERDALEAKAKAERDAAAKKLAEQNAAAEKKLAAERAETARLKAEAEAKAKAEADARAADERKARAAAAAPDADKLRAFADSLCCLTFPDMATEAGKTAKINAVQRLNALVANVRAMADGLAGGVA